MPRRIKQSFVAFTLSNIGVQVKQQLLQQLLLLCTHRAKTCRYNFYYTATTAPWQLVNADGPALFSVPAGILRCIHYAKSKHKTSDAHAQRLHAP